MQDSNLDFTLSLKGEQEVISGLERVSKSGQKATASLNGVGAAAKGSTSGIDSAKKSTDGLAEATDRDARARKNWFTHIAKTTVMSAMVNKSFLALTDSMTKATRQVDLIGNFPAVMGALGVSAADASASMDKLREYVQGVGGDLTLATNAVSRFVQVNKNAKASVAIFAGVNNALIAGGATAESQAASLEQLIQGYSRGRFEGEEFRSMQTSMNLALNETAKALNLPNSQALQEALVQGEVSMNQFMAQLARVSTGTGPVAQAATAQMQGVGFAATVMGNTLTNGLTAIYQAVGRQNIIAFFSVLTDVISILASWTVILINALITLFNLISGIFGGPQIKNLAGEAGNVATNLGAGADAASGIGSGLDDAGKSAKKLNKQLASFDQMNVLQDKTPASGGGGGGGGGGGAAAPGFDPGSALALDDIFNNINGKVKEVSALAKVLAGILAGIAGLAVFNKLLSWARVFGGNLKWLGGIAKTIWGPFGAAASSAIGGIGKAWAAVMNPITRAAWAGRILLAWDTLVGGIAKTIGRIPGIVGSVISRVPGALSKIPALIARLSGSWVGVALRGVSTAITAAIGAVATALGVPFAAAAAIVAAAVAAIVAIVWVIWTNWETIWGFIKNVASSFWDWLVAVWSGIVDVLAGPFQLAWQIISSIFILLVAIVAITLETIYNILVGIGMWVWNNVIEPVGKFFADLWNGVVQGVVAMWNGAIAILVTVGSWIMTNVIKPVTQFFSDLWSGITRMVSQWWDGVMTIIRPIASWININIISPVSQFFKGLWDGVKAMVSGFITSVQNIFSPLVNWIKANIIDRISSFFGGLWRGITSGVEAVVAGVRSIMGTMAGLIKAPINGIIDLINGVIGSINKIKVPDWVPGLGGQSPNFPKIPRLARGGVVTDSILANVGEAGDEVVLPLENYTGWMDILADKINSSGGQPVQLVVQIGEEKIVDKVVNLINDKSYMSGRNAIHV